MEKKLFQDPIEIENAIAHLQALQVSEGWLILVQILQENIEAITEQILDPESDDSKEDQRMLKWRRRYMERLISTPEDTIRQLETGGPGETDLDPYELV